jgi:hypothetical protein
MLMLTLVALWAALPALACLTPAPAHACCRHVMQDCESSMMSTVSCCDAHSSDSSVPPAQASRAQAIDLLAHACVATGVTVNALDGFKIARTAETPPGTTLSSHTSVLRI